MAPNIRRLNEHDAEAWWALRLEALERDPRGFAQSAAEHRATTVEQAAKRLAKDPSTTTFVVGAFADGLLIGVAGFARETREKQRHRGNVWGVYVTTANRGQGIARRLLTELIRLAREQEGLERILLCCEARSHAQRVYESVGFRAFGHDPRALRIGDSYVDDNLMLLDLLSP